MFVSLSAVLNITPQKSEVHSTISTPATPAGQLLERSVIVHGIDVYERDIKTLDPGTMLNDSTAMILMRYMYFHLVQ